MLETALRYPYDDGDGLRAIAIGSLLTLLGVLVIPTILVGGYVLRSIRSVSAGDEHPPVWNEWGELLVDGLKAVVVTLVYLLIPAALVGVSIAAVFLPFAGGNGTTALVASVIALVSVPLFLAAVYVLPAALVGVAVTGRLGAAASFGRLWRVITTGEYAIAWLFAFLVSLVASALTGALTGLTVIGGLLGAVFSFYAAVVSAHLYANGVDATRFDRAERPTDASRPAG